MNTTGVPGSENIRLHAIRSRGPAPQAVPVELHGRLRPERGEDLVALADGELVERELVVVAQERRPRVVVRDDRQRSDDLLERLGLAARERQPQVLVEQEREL